MVENREIAVPMALLLVMAEAEGPLGAGAAREALLRDGVDISEATAGRLLRDLEREGLALKVGVQGRKLTEKGRETVAEICRRRTNEASAEALLEALRPTDKGELVDLVVARRALETETARLAALNGTEEELERLREIVAETRRLTSAGRSMAGSDGAFHAQIARMSHNSILEAALHLIWHNGQYSPLLEAIRHKQGRTLGSDHERLFQAIASRDGERARLAMTEHLTNVLRDVEALPDDGA